MRNRGVYRYRVPVFEVRVRRFFKRYPVWNGVLDIVFDPTVPILPPVAQKTLVDDRGEMVEVGLI